MRLVSRPRLALPGTALAASVLLSVTLGAGTVAAATDYLSNCSVNLRDTASTSGAVVDMISTNTLVTTTGTVSGSNWSATCGGSSVAGTSWYVITAVNGNATSSLYGRASVYAATGLFSLAPPPPPPGSQLEGIDVSHWQGTINWPVVAQYKSFAIIKATESTTYVDPQYATNHAGARAAGMRTGAYHFAQPSGGASDAIAEADWFVAHANLLPGDLNPALDLEQTGGLSVGNLQTWVLAWLDEVYAKTGIRPMVYTSPSFWSTSVGNTHAIADAGYTVLWIAHWGVTSPTVPANNWGGHGWTFWQYSSSLAVPGISGNVDHDRYNGTDLTKVTYGANFALSATPPAASIEQGASSSAAVSITRTWFTLPIGLTVTGAPAGATATLDVSSTTGNAAMLTVHTSNSGTVTPVGSYPLMITGSANGVTRTATVTLTVTDGLPPKVTAPVSRLLSPSVLGSGGLWGFTSWTGSDQSGIGAFTLQEQLNGGAWTTIGPASPTATSASEAWTLNDSHRFRMQATDSIGNTSDWVYGPAFKPVLTQDTGSIHYSSGWTTGSSAAFSGGTSHYTRTAGAWASQTFTGAGIAWVSYKGPNRGKARVYIDGALVATVDLYAATAQSRAVVFGKTWSANGTHTIKIVCLATSGRPRIDLDGFVRLVLS